MASGKPVIDDVFASIDTLNEATKYENLNRANDFYPDLVNYETFGRGQKLDLLPDKNIYRQETLHKESPVPSPLNNSLLNETSKDVKSIGTGRGRGRGHRKVTQFQETNHLNLTEAYQDLERVTGGMKLDNGHRHHPPGFEKHSTHLDRRHNETIEAKTENKPFCFKKTSHRPPGFNGPLGYDDPSPKFKGLNNSNDLFFKQFGVSITGAQPLTSDEVLFNAEKYHDAEEDKEEAQDIAAKKPINSGLNGIADLLK